jgi:tellurite resistance protein TehA-like permease
VSDNNPTSWPGKFFSACLLILLGVVALGLAVDLIETIWPWLLGASLLMAAVVVAVWILRARSRRW